MEARVTERPILFSGPMVRALLNGTKTQTRRALRQQPILSTDTWEFCESGGWIGTGPSPATGGTRQTLCWTKCPYGQPGDRLWVRETWADLEHLSGGNYKRQAIYRADDIELYGDEDEPVNVAAPDMRWRPSIHMPRWASRIQLEITDVRVERLQDISEADAIAEGIDRVENDFGNGPAYCDYGLARLDDTAEWFRSPVNSYRTLWESINGAGSWDANPWVWVVEFKKV